MAGEITWTRDKLIRFKLRYTRAVRNSEEQFDWEGHAFLTTYAKYLIEYLEGLFK